MKQCNCLDDINQQMNIAKAIKGGMIVEFDLLSGKTHSTFEYKEKRGKVERAKSIIVQHSFCPFCGEKYKT